PMRVDYCEKFSAAGKTLGGFLKREGRPTERETLVCRLIDRPIRPMIQTGYYKEIQLLTYVFSYDGVHSQEPLALCAASAALTISDIPLVKPLGAVRVGRVGGEFVINPTVEQQGNSDLDLMLAGTDDAILMIEGYCDFLSEEELLDAVHEGHEAIKVICEALADWQKQIGKEKDLSDLRVVSDDLKGEIRKIAEKDIDNAYRVADKKSREAAVAAVKEKVMETLCPEGEEPKYPTVDIGIAFKSTCSDIVRSMILKEKKRSDGRSPDQVREIFVDKDILPRTHGSTLFTRGDTQSLSVCTLGGGNMAQRFESLDESDGHRTFYLQYSFPPFSVGEVGRAGAPGRREVGHGKLAERALAATIPGQDKFPYTIRLEANITESNGSSSMATVCGGALSMMCAGVPIQRPIAGIAMGLILEKDDSFAILSDIIGDEDHLGDMDFKITGDDKGITAFQLDIKVEGITKQIMESALAQAKQGRIHILKKMLEACPKHADNLSKHAPRIESMKVKPSQIGTIIGPGGKQIRAITEETGVDIDIDDDGIVNIISNDADAMEKAKEIIFNLTAEPEIGKTYRGKITSVVDFGVFVRIYSVEGLCHVSELSHERIEDVKAHFKVGELIDVVVKEMKNGKYSLSHKALLKKMQPQG
ncbi:MAG: polyribonucleotide nucleotidyltransferase, partial [Simkaniaceae bacterium]|nr:polyribonucleotide nucleotidyltransferase [Simkaniaceae bacterium]